MKKPKLTIFQRILAVCIYTAVFLFSCYWFNGQDLSFLTDSTNKYNLLFVSGALLLIFGSYIAEPFFTKPVDVITNSTAVILALLSINNPENFVGYQFLFVSASSLLILSVFVIFLSYFQKIEIFQKVFFEILTKAGQSKIVFSFVYICTIFSYFKDAPLEFTFFLTFWIILITQFFVESIILWFSKIFDFIFHNKKYSEILGEAIGCENPFLYKVEVDFLKHKAKEVKKGELVYLGLENNVGAVGIIINEKQLLNKKWITIYLLEEKNRPLKISLKTKTFISSTNTIFSKDNAVYTFDINSIKENEEKEKIEKNYLYKNRNNFIGYIKDGSDINKIRFHSLVDSTNDKYQSVREGAVIKTKIHDQETLFQIIDGKTNEEPLEKHDVYGFLVGIAQKLGKYNQSKQELETVEWLPNIYSPVFLDEMKSETKNVLAIGKLPTTDFEIVIKEPDSLVTHNTAILGILGIGKSCLTFELIQKVIANTDVKVVCIDITNEYKKELTQYLDQNLIQSDDENIFNNINTKFEYIHDENGAKNYEKSGNENDYKKELEKDLLNFLFAKESIPENETFNADKKIRIYNPDYHKVSKGEKVGFNVITTELTQAEKTRRIAEEIFKIVRKLKISEEQKAKVLIVFEEAHSLIPEWNSTVNSGDQSASNGTAKVILQGRKYGLGSFVVTQRTANISKSILNQCNTIFAMRVFDDTGKQFLENYIGSDYSNTLPTLEERHAIVVGKALKLKQPVIVELHDKDDVLIKDKKN